MNMKSLAIKARELPWLILRRRTVTDFDTRPESRIMEALSFLPRDSTFVDLGSRKGRALAVASRMRV